jgi:hypothetical protein
MGPGAQAVAMMWVSLDTVPEAIKHRLEGVEGSDQQTLVLESPAVPVRGTPVRIAPPLRGDRWLAANGPPNETHHRRSWPSPRNALRMVLRGDHVPDRVRIRVPTVPAHARGQTAETGGVRAFPSTEIESLLSAHRRRVSPSCASVRTLDFFVRFDVPPAVDR